MTAPNEDLNESHGGEQRRRYKWRYGPLRLVIPWLCMAVGILLIVVAIIGWADHHDEVVNFWIGIWLIVLGIVAFFGYRWMAKKGI